MIINSRDKLLELKNPVPFFQENELNTYYKELLDAKEELYKYLNETPDAAGISAPQLGIKLPIFAIKMDNGELEHFIIPKVVAENKEMYFSSEGCMSLRFEDRTVYCLVPRLEELEVMYFRFNHKNEIKRTSKKFSDRYKIPNDGTKLSYILNKEKGKRKHACSIVQHELNHLYGLLILDVAAPLGNRDEKTKKDENKEIYRVQLSDDTFDYIIEDEEITLYHKKNISELKHTEDSNELIKSLVGLWSKIDDTDSNDNTGTGDNSSN